MSKALLARGLPVTTAAIAFVLSACSQSPPPPSQAAAPPPATQGQAPAAPDAAATASANPQQNASVADLLAPAAQQPAADHAPVEAAPAAAGANIPADGMSQTAPAPADNAEYATVISVKKIEGPQQVCHDETVVEKREPQDKHKVAGTAIGALAGAVIGNQFGGGRGRTVATVGGAVAGGAVGRKVQENQQDKDTVTRVVKRCRPVSPSEAGKPLYDIVYSYQGQTFQARLDYDPGDRVALPVRSVE